MLTRERNEAFDEVQQALLAQIEQLASIQFYRQVRDQMENNRTILKLIKQKKRVQKELVNAQHVHKTVQVGLLKQQLQDVEDELFAIPLYQQYLTAVEEAQDDLDMISAYIEQQFAPEMVESEERQ